MQLPDYSMKPTHFFPTNFIMDIHIISQVGSGLLRVLSSEKLSSVRVVTQSGEAVEASVLSQAPLSDGRWQTRLDAGALRPWSPDSPSLYRLVAQGGVDIRFGHSELSRFQNKSILLNGSPLYLRGVIRGIEAHDHPNMTGGSLYDAAVKYIRQAKKYGFNLVRFHSTIPWPEFVEAADREGFLIHAEIGFAYERNEKGEKTGLAMDQSAWRETLLRYRNSPSMAIFCIGNEMHNAGRVPQVHDLYEEGRRLAPNKLILDNSGWGEYDRDSADVFAQHIAYFFPYGRHAGMFSAEDPWFINGSVCAAPFDMEATLPRAQAAVHRAVAPVRPTLAHEAVHYIDVPDYYALREKFDAFCAKVGPAYLEANGIKRPRFMDALPQLIERKGLKERFTELVAASRHFRQACIKQYLESCRLSTLCGFEMLQFADCLKYENKNGIVDCFDDDKDIAPEWMRQFNGDFALLAAPSTRTFFWRDGFRVDVYASDFLPQPEVVGNLEVSLAYADGTVETLCTQPSVRLAGGLQKLASVSAVFPERMAAEQLRLVARFNAGDGAVWANEWRLWGYPKAEMPPVPSNTLVTNKFDEHVFDALSAGKTVLLTLPKAPTAGQAEYFFPGARERCKPCIWDRGSNLGGGIDAEPLRRALALPRYFDLNLYSLLDDAYKVNLDTFPVKVQEWMWGVDKPVRDRMKGLVFGVKEFIDADTLRNFSHLFTVRVGKGALVVCTLNVSLAAPSDDPVVRNFSAALLAHLDELAQTSCAIAPEALRAYLKQVQAKGPSKEDTMNHFWEIDNKLVEDTLFWEEAQLDLRKID